MHNIRATSNEQRYGFTLIEVMVTTAIVVIVLGLIFTSLYMTTLSSKSLITKNKRYLDLMKAYFQLRRQIIALYPTENSKYIIKTEPGTKEKGDLLYIITADGANFKGIIEAQYQIKKDKKNNPCLAYKETPYAGYKTAYTAKEDENEWGVLSKKITGIKIDCCKNNLWFTQWDDKTAPDKIRIIFYYKDEDIDKKFSFIVVPGIIEFEEIMNRGLASQKLSPSPYPLPAWGEGKG